MQRINVVGTSGSGKSTLSRRLAAQLRYPYIEIDTLFWGKIGMKRRMLLSMRVLSAH
jgi:adenylate kinase family enzyme